MIKEEYDMELRCYKDVISHSGILTKLTMVGKTNHYLIGEVLLVTKNNYDDMLEKNVLWTKERFKIKRIPSKERIIF